MPNKTARAEWRGHSKQFPRQISSRNRIVMVEAGFPDAATASGPRLRTASCNTGKPKRPCRVKPSKIVGRNRMNGRVSDQQAFAIRCADNRNKSSQLDRGESRRVGFRFANGRCAREMECVMHPGCAHDSARGDDTRQVRPCSDGRPKPAARMRLDSSLRCRWRPWSPSRYR